MSKNTGGAAFPLEGATWRTGSRITATGMTLRDYFAGQALTGFYAGYVNNENIQQIPPERIAEEVYGMADAMIAERNREK